MTNLSTYKRYLKINSSNIFYCFYNRIGVIFCICDIYFWLESLLMLFCLWLTRYQHSVRTLQRRCCLFSNGLTYTTGSSSQIISINYSSTNMDTKTCPRCKIEKMKTDYSKDSSKPDKIFYCCKSCDKRANTQWQKYNRTCKQSLLKTNNIHFEF